MEYRVCNRCGENKPMVEFYRNSRGYLGRRSHCKKCTHLYNTSSARREAAAVRRAEQKRKPCYREAARICEERYRRKKGTRKVKREYARKRYHSDLEFRLSRILRTRVSDLLRGKNKGASAVGDLGCSVAELVDYLEKQFIPEWSWENYGIVWEVDHIVPFSFFDLTDDAQVKKACHYTNLRPLSIRENRRKVQDGRRTEAVAQLGCEAEQVGECSFLHQGRVSGGR